MIEAGFYDVHFSGQSPWDCRLKGTVWFDPQRIDYFSTFETRAEYNSVRRLLKIHFGSGDFFFVDTPAIQILEAKMPEKISKTAGGKYRVTGPSGVHAKGTTLAKAQAQKRIIEQADAGKPVKKKK